MAPVPLCQEHKNLLASPQTWAPVHVQPCCSNITQGLLQLLSLSLQSRADGYAASNWGRLILADSPNLCIAYKSIINLFRCSLPVIWLLPS